VPFKEPRNRGVICSPGIVEGDVPILLLAHETDASWQFLDGETIRPEDAAVDAHLEEIYRLDSSIAEVANLPNGWSAERPTKDEPWFKFET
jgi:hypothetical protein